MASIDLDLERNQVDQLYNGLAVNAVIFGALLILFEANRGIKLIYQRRVRPKYEHASPQRLVPESPSKHPLLWILDVLRISDDQTLKMIGLDGYVLLRFIKLCFKFSFYSMIWGLVVLVPLYSINGRISYGWGQFTMANIPEDPSLSAFWAPAILAYLFCGGFCYLMYIEYEQFVDRRLNFLVEGYPGTPSQMHYTLMVEDVPKALRSNDIFKEFFGSLFPGEIFSVEFSQRVNELDVLTNKRSLICSNLEQAIASRKGGGDRPTTWVAKVPEDTNHPDYELLSAVSLLPRDQVSSFSSRISTGLASCLGYCVVDSEMYHRLLLAKLNDDVTKEQAAVLVPNVAIADANGDSHPNHECAPESDSMKPHSWDTVKSVFHDSGLEMGFHHAYRGLSTVSNRIKLVTLGTVKSSTAFVTLTSRVASCNARQILLSHSHFCLSVKAAPDPRNIIWKNVAIPQKQISTRLVLTSAIFGLGIVFWSFVVTFITTFGNLQSIAEQFPPLQVYTNTGFYQLLNSYIASSILLIFLGVLPIIFDLTSRYYEGLKLESDIQESILNRYFNYQLANVFVSIGLGSISSSINAVVLQPTSILSILGGSVPNLSFYFTMIVITKTFTATLLTLLQAVPVLLFHIVTRCIGVKKSTRRSLSTGLFAAQSLPYGLVYPDLMMVLMIMMTYACIAPLILPFCLFFYGFTFVVLKYNLLYVYEASYESGGFMWYTVFGRSMICLIAATIALICYLGIRQTFQSGPFYFVLPLPIFIRLFWLYCDSVFKGPSIKLSLESAIKLDQKDIGNEQRNATSFQASLYRQPSLSQGPAAPIAYRKSTRSCLTETHPVVALSAESGVAPESIALSIGPSIALDGVSNDHGGCDENLSVSDEDGDDSSINELVDELLS